MMVLFFGLMVNGPLTGAHYWIASGTACWPEGGAQTTLGLRKHFSL